jgi:hypothetical protein
MKSALDNMTVLWVCRYQSDVYMSNEIVCIKTKLVNGLCTEGQADSSARVFFFVVDC